jgi:hypoxanthine-guanine phosphoribosyltransferase
LLNKKADRIVDVPVRYVGFEIPPVFVVGYGLDQNDQYRNLDYIGVIDAE